MVAITVARRDRSPGVERTDISRAAPEVTPGCEGCWRCEDFCTLARGPQGSSAIHDVEIAAADAVRQPVVRCHAPRDRMHAIRIQSRIESEDPKRLVHASVA